MKRARSNSSAGLTGGTGDVNPQLFKIDYISVGATTNAGTSAENINNRTVTLPISSFQQPASGRAVVMEVLKVFFTADTESITGGTGIVALRYRMFLTTGATQLSAISDLSERGMSGATTFAYTQKQFEKAGTATGYSTAYSGNIHDEVLDLTDGAGHGILIASPQITLNVYVRVVNETGTPGLGFSSDSRWNATILYRFKEVPLAEYIGIQQSQQNF